MEVRGVVEQQRGVLRDREEERERLSQAAVSGERDREDQRDRQHREDTASLAILQKQLSALTNEKYIRPPCQLKTFTPPNLDYTHCTVFSCFV